MYWVGVVLSYAISLYLLILTIRAIISFVPAVNREWRPKGVLLVVAEVTFTLTDPPLRFLRRFVPPLRLGTVQLDLGFMLLWFGLIILQRFIPAFF